MTLIDVAREFCSTPEEVHAVGLGVDTGVLLALGAPLVLDANMIPVTFPAQTREEILAEYQYYFTGLAVGYAGADPTMRAKAKAGLELLKLWWRR